MDNILGIISEYNPFHNGHVSHILQSKELCNADCTVCVMSGNFTQRGTPAIVDKWARTQMALSNGVDIVIELPVIYSIASAEHFAYGAIKILDSLGIVDFLSFGSECAKLDVLDEIATVLHEQPKSYVTLLKHELSKGVSFPRARENALLIYLNDVRRYANILSNPNNILGIEYLKALKRIKSPITPLTIKRDLAPHNSTIGFGNYASSSAIRKMITNEDNIKPFVPDETYEILKNCINYGKVVLDLSAFEKQIIYMFRKMSIEEIANLPDVSEGLENKIKNAANEANTIKELINIIKSKRYTETRIQRIALYALVGITKQTLSDLYKVSPYIRILGMNDKGKEFLSLLKYKNFKLPIVTSVKEFLDTNKSKALRDMLAIDILATNIYTLGFDHEPYANLDFTKKLVIL